MEMPTSSQGGALDLNTSAFYVPARPPWAPHLLSPAAVTDTGEAKAYGK